MFKKLERWIIRKLFTAAFKSGQWLIPEHWDAIFGMIGPLPTALGLIIASEWISRNGPIIHNCGCEHSGDTSKHRIFSFHCCYATAIAIAHHIEQHSEESDDIPFNKDITH